MRKSLQKIKPYDANTSRLIVETDRKTMHARTHTLGCSDFKNKNTVHILITYIMHPYIFIHPPVKNCIHDIIVLATMLSK